MTAHQITRIAPSKYRRELVSLRTVLVATLQLSDRSGRHQLHIHALAGCGKTRESRFLTAKAIRNDKKTGLYGTSKFVPFSNTFQTRVFPQPPRQTWRPAFAIAAATYPAGRVRTRPEDLPVRTYRTAMSETDATLANSGTPASLSALMRITCPACGDCNPSLRASMSIRSGSRNEASSSRSARFISTKPSRCVLSDSILYPYSMALKCCQANVITSKNRQQSAKANCFISRLRFGSSTFTKRELSIGLAK